jgi:hypothetical protein
MNSTFHPKKCSAEGEASEVVGTRKSAQLRGCPNQRSSEMRVCEPWSFVPQIPTDARKDKAAFRIWAAENSTEHLFYSASEAINADRRVSNNTNPVKLLHGLIADYDSATTAPVIEAQMAKSAGENSPNWLSRTFSDGIRLVWLFEEPIPMDNESLVKPLLKIAAEELKVKNIFAGFDEPAWYKLSNIYEVGRNWVQFANSPITLHRLHEMLVRAAEKVRWRNDGMQIPIEVIAEEVERRFPGRWDGSFEIGARGCAFFNLDSSNPTAAIVQEGGMVTFSLDKVFYSWREIFGVEFVRKYEEDRIGAAAAEAWYDGNKYWLKSDKGVWQAYGKDDFALRLRTRHRLHSTKDKRETCSEVDRVLMFVQEQRRVEGGLPSIYKRDDIITMNGKRFVNSAAVRVAEPADVAQNWGDEFPFLADFLETCWDEQPVPCVVPERPSQSAKDIFLSWLKRAYVSALQGDMLRGHALFLVGTVGVGKTLLSTRIIAAAMGGSSEAADFLLSASGFNKELASVGVWQIDDATISADAASRDKFSAILKRVVANPSMSFHPKGIDQQRVDWPGRVVTTLNSDAASIGMIPNIDSGLQDKIIVLKFSDSPRVFPQKHQLEATIRTELPYLLRFVIDWDIPSSITGENRFGIEKGKN